MYARCFYRGYRYEAIQTGISIVVRVFRKYGKIGLCKFSIFGVHIDDAAKREIESAIDNILKKED